MALSSSTAPPTIVVPPVPTKVSPTPSTSTNNTTSIPFFSRKSRKLYFSLALLIILFILTFQFLEGPLTQLNTTIVTTATTVTAFDAQPQTTTTTTIPKEEENEIEQEIEQGEERKESEQIVEENFWQKQFESTEQPHPLIVNRERAPKYEWWKQLDAYRNIYGGTTGESRKEFQIDRDMYLKAFDHVINTTLSLSSGRRSPITTENSPFVYATFIRFSHTELLPGNKLYIHGIIALIASWVLSKSPFPFIILHTGPCPPNLKKRLESIPSHSLKLIHIDDSFVPLPPTMQSYDAWRVSFQKLAIFSFKQYEKIVFLDSDTMLVQNVDELFGLPALAAVWDNCIRCKIDRHINAGVFLLEPSDTVWKAMQEYTRKESCLSKVFKWSDQEMINCLFDHRQPIKDIVGKWHQLPLVYNFYINNCGCRDESPHDPLYTKWNDGEVKIVHYTCASKPWENLSETGRKNAAKPTSCQDRFNGRWLAFWDKGMELLGMDPTKFVDGNDAAQALLT